MLYCDYYYDCWIWKTRLLILLLAARHSPFKYEQFHFWRIEIIKSRVSFSASQCASAAQQIPIPCVCVCVPRYALAAFTLRTTFRGRGLALLFRRKLSNGGVRAKDDTICRKMITRIYN